MYRTGRRGGTSVGDEVAVGRLGFRGLTLVELLVVIAIIGMLMALLLPAVQAARESGRIAACRNHLRQLSVGWLSHLHAHGFFPSSGWGWNWTGEADRGFGKTQPGGWAYDVLPYVGEVAVHQLDAGLTGSAQRREASQRTATPVKIFYCPSRREAKVYAHVHYPFNADRAAKVAKTDYAANGGDVRGGLWKDWKQASESQIQADIDCTTGITGTHSEFHVNDVADGLSMTLLVAEKYLNPDRYEIGCDLEGADNGDAWQGKDWDVIRWTYIAPRADAAGVSNHERFGSPHAAAFGAAACDGSVRGIAYSINPTVWRRLGHRRDAARGVADWP